MSWVLLPLQYAGAGRRKVTMRREDDRRRAMLFSLDKRERERERENTFRSSVYTAHAFACQGGG